MDLLINKDGHGFLCLGSEQIAVTSVTAENIEAAIVLIMENSDIELAEGDGLVNPAEEAIFVQLRQSFQEVIDSKDATLSEIDSLFEEAEKKYLS